MFSNERELLARMLQAEAGNQGREGMRAVGAVIDNRRRTPGYGGTTFEDVMMAPGQFSPANSITGYAGGEQGVDWGNLTASETAYSVADEILSGQYDDPTGGALNFLNPTISQPAWLKDMRNTRQIGDHLFGTAGAASARPRNGEPYQGPSVIAGGRGTDFVAGGEGEDRLEEISPQQGESNPYAGYADALSNFARGGAAMIDDEPIRFGRRQAPVSGRPGAIPKMNTTGLGFSPRLSDNLPVPFNPDTTRAFSQYGLDSLSEGDIDQAFGEYAQVGNGAFGLAAQAVGGAQAYGVAEEDAPLSIREATAAVRPDDENQQPSPFDVEGYKKKRARRRFAADALEILSVGLGQISANQPLDLGGVLENQSRRRTAMEGSMAGNGSRNSPDGAVGAYSDLLIPGNEAALKSFLLQNGVDERVVAMVDQLGPAYAQEMLETAIDYRMATPQREQLERRRERAAQWARGNATSPEQGEAYYDAVKGSDAVFEQVESQMAEAISTRGATASGVGPALLAEPLVQADDVLLAEVRSAIANNDSEGLAKAAKEVYSRRESAAEKNGRTAMADEDLLGYANDLGVPNANQYNTQFGIDREGLNTAIDSTLQSRTNTARLTEEAAPILTAAAQTLRTNPSGEVGGQLRIALEVAEDARNNGRLTSEMLGDVRRLTLEAGGDVGGTPTMARTLEALTALEAIPNVNIDQATIDRALTPAGGKERRQILDLLQSTRSSQANAAASRAGSPSEGEALVSEAEVEAAMAGLSGPAAAAAAPVYMQYRRALRADDAESAQAIGARLVDSATAGLDASLVTAGEGTAQTAVDLAARNANMNLYADVFDGDALLLAASGDVSGAVDMRSAAVAAAAEEDKLDIIQEQADSVGAYLAERWQDPAIAGMFRNITSQEDFNERWDNLRADKPDRVREGFELLNNDSLAQVIDAQSRTDAGLGQLSEYTQQRVNEINEISLGIEQEYAARSNLRAGQQVMMDLISAPTYDKSSGGALTPFFNAVSSFVGDAAGPELRDAITNRDVSTTLRIINANTGEFFGDFRAEGSGAMSDAEGKWFREAMANAGDDTMKMALIGQRILRMDRNRLIEAQARRQWVSERIASGETQQLETGAGLEKFVSEYKKENSVDVFPIYEGRDLTGLSEYTAALEEDGKIDDQTVIGFMDGDQRRFAFYGELRRSVLRELQ